MKRIAWLGALLAVCGPGCVGLDVFREDAHKPPAVEAALPPAPPPVMPEDVNEKSPMETARKLRAELERDARQARPEEAEEGPKR